MRSRIQKVRASDWAGFVSLVLFASCPLDSRGTEDLVFFEKEIRPLLIENCLECHASDTEQKGGLLLDSREGWATGGDSGPAIVSGDVDGSLLIEAIRYQDPHLEMPPKTRLEPTEIAALEKWVAMGAPDPREGTVEKTKSGMSVEEGRKFWSYLPVSSPEVPTVNHADWSKTEIDRFLFSKMTEAGLTPTGLATPEAALRRLHLDLTGLPPTPEEIRAFAKDPSDEAWTREVDRLLASPQFGERWARHWLDVARFGESFTLRGLIMREAWRYRDYVIDAFNEDRPYDQFIREQLAGDLLVDPKVDLKAARRSHIATGYLALGNSNLEEQDKRQLDLDIVDEQLDTLGKTFLGQTLGCARCHDHKFDPIPTRDYHAMAGILASTVSLSHSNVSNWLDLPLPLDPAEEVLLSAKEAELTVLDEELKLAEAAREKAVAEDPARASDSRPEIVAAEDLPGWVVDDVDAEKVGDWKSSVHTKTYIGEGYLQDEDEGKGLKTLTFVARVPEAGRYEVRVAWAPGVNRAKSVPVMISSADGDFPMKIDLSGTPPIEGRFMSLGQYRFETNGANFVMISNEGTEGYVVVDAVQFLPPGEPETHQITSLEPVDSEAAAKRREAVAEVARIKKEIAAHKKEGTVRPRFLGVREAEIPADLPVLARGIVHNPIGDPVPRGMLQVASLEGAAVLKIDDNESGRLDLANWIASPENPLTARVFVNRAWHWMFGAGIARTVDNFGTTGEAPSHPELLDWLAKRFVEEGWSMKGLVRGIALSRAYRLAVPADPGRWTVIDPENRYFSHASLRRVEAEVLRDSVLAVSGRLDLAAGGITIRPGAANDYGYLHDSERRSIYLPALRNSPSEMLEAFNMADPSRTTGSRELGTVAPQALFMLNNDFILTQSEFAAKRLLADELSDEERLAWATLRVLGRDPMQEERAIVSSLLGAASEEESLEAWTTLFQGLFASLDFRYLE